ncbi:sigma-70 family RNA polymerase sigma factor [Hyphomicrobium sp. D-2]|uniref:RNA polymerase sigma factor n=1 Tax=Hyphomicrobium sp. D-2 TaxID=3041621 RepID=UPI00245549B7|nr:sigma-70 family RNA polymerase sigma factor [Hyphomicrobium sp. D-2]MDH4983703.1 sigma-70 family RNA polymerase sigma factor [Hyphomicrobium sp. D-2]
MSTLMKIVRDPATAEDLAHDAYIRVCRAVEVSPIDQVEAFLHQTARNLALDHERRRRVRARFEPESVAQDAIEQVPSDSPSVEAVVIERERLRLFEQVFETLPERARRVWVLAHLEGWSYAQIAAHLGIARNTAYNDVKLVMMRCHDALMSLDRD